MDINFGGYRENVVTFAAENDVVAGVAVKMSGSGTVCACESDDTMIGVAVNVRNGYAAVQLSGYAEFVTDDSNITVGYNKLKCGTDNKVVLSDTGREYLVISMYENKVGIIL